MLYEVVIRIARKGERIQAQSVDVGQFEQPECRICRCEVRTVETCDVVPQQECRPIDEFIQPRERPGQVAAAEQELGAGIAPHGGELMNAAVFLAHFQIDGHATRRKDDRIGQLRHV